jgi:hypothetical protein
MGAHGEVWACDSATILAIDQAQKIFETFFTRQLTRQLTRAG